MTTRALRALVALLCVVAGCDSGGAAPDEALEAAPDFVLPLLEGGEVDLAELRGKTVLLDFWATWCAPCEVQMPILDELWRDADRGKRMIVGVSVDTDGPGAVASWVEQRGLRYPIAFGDQELAMRFGILGFPSLVLIDPQGRIRARHTGVWSRAEIEQRLEAIEAGDPVEP